MTPRLKYALRANRYRIAAALALLAVTTYALFFTPEKRAVRHHLSEADGQSRAAIAARLKPVHALFAKGRKGARPFAQSALSWSGKWALVKGIVGGDSHREYLAGEFGRHVFTPEELQEAIEGACRAYASDLDGIEGRMLVGLRADLADRPAGTLALQGHDAFAREYRLLAAKLVDQSSNALAVSVGREVASMAAAQAATAAALSAASEMGVQGTVLGLGAGSAVTTLGVGAIVAIIVDYLLDIVFKWAGHDPEAEIEATVVESIDRMESALLRDPGLRGRIGLGSKGSLRVELERLHGDRSKLRGEVVSQLLEGGVR